MNNLNQPKTSSRNRPPYSLPTLKSHTKSLPTTIIDLDQTPTPSKYTALQTKARQSYKKILKTEGILKKQAWAFFYITNTKAAAQGGHFKKMAEIRT